MCASLKNVQYFKARKRPQKGALKTPIRRLTPNCRIFLSSPHQRQYATEIERFLTAMGVTVDLCIYRETVKPTNLDIDDHISELQG